VTGWGDLSTRALFNEDHPTPALNLASLDGTDPPPPGQGEASRALRIQACRRTSPSRAFYRVIKPWLTSTFDELIVYCRTTLLLSKKITRDFLSPSAPL